MNHGFGRCFRGLATARCSVFAAVGKDMTDVKARQVFLSRYATQRTAGHRRGSDRRGPIQTRRAFAPELMEA